MNRLSSWIALSLVLCALGCGEKERPSVLLVTLDTTRFDVFSCEGGEARTPYFDALAREGLHFKEAYTPVPITTPAHASLLTGLYPASHGIHDNGMYVLHDDAQTLAEVMKDHGYETSAFVSAFVLSRVFKVDQGFEVFDDTGMTTSKYEKRGDATVEAAMAHLSKGGDDPFFCWVHLFDAHAPYAPPSPYAEEFKGREYAGEVSYADEQMGRLIEAARARDPDTLIVVTSDHGEGLGEHDEQTHGIFLYQTTVHIPLVMAGGGLHRKTVTDLARLIDIMPTLCDHLGLEAPDDMDGVNLLDSINGDGDPVESVVLESYLPFLSYGWSPLHGIRVGTTKAIEAPDPEYYELLRDEGETRNLASSQRMEMERALGLLRGQRQSMSPRFADEPPLGEDMTHALESLGYVSARSGEDLSKARGPDPKAMMPVLHLKAQAQYLLNRGKAREAIMKLLQILERNPENALVREMLGGALLRTGDYRMAKDALERAIKKRPDRAMSHYLVGRCYEGLEDVERAVTSYRAALALDERFPLAHLRLGWIHHARGDAGTAREHFMMYLQHDVSGGDERDKVEELMKGSYG